jgi:hypothetical protein
MCLYCIGLPDKQVQDGDKKGGGLVVETKYPIGTDPEVLSVAGCGRRRCISPAGRREGGGAFGAPSETVQLSRSARTFGQSADGADAIAGGWVRGEEAPATGAFGLL